jgi:formiminotetrahydrofolate cyclodeaminase
MPTLTQLSLTELLDAFSSPSPTPGGGSAAALSGALGASLLAMVAGLAKTKTGTADARVALDEARGQLLVVRGTLVELVDRDAAAYDLVVAAFRLPKSTDDEKAARTTAIQAALLAATEVPIETMEACVKAIEAGRAVAEHGNPSARSDIAAGMHLIGTGATAAMFNVETNITSLEDPAIVEALTARLHAIAATQTPAMRDIYVKAGIVDLMKASSARMGFRNHEPPPRPG